MSKKVKITIGVCVAIAVALVIILWPRVHQKTEELTCELGDELTTDMSDYLKGNKKLMEEAVLDVDKVNTGKVGTYKATVTSKNKVFTYTIKVEDTTPPTLKLKDIKYVGLGMEYNADKFVESAKDLSRDLEYYFLTDDGDEATFVFDEDGKQTISVEAVDPSGNRAVEYLDVETKEPPVLINVDEDKWITDADLVRYEDDEDLYYNPLSDVLALDPNDGFIEVTCSGDDMYCGPEPETQEYIYTATNSYGIEVTAKATVHYDFSMSEEEDKENHLSDEEMQLLLDNDYFSYEPLAEGDVEKATKLIHPSLIHLEENTDYSNGGYKYCAGSGFICDIQKDYIYVITDDHCAKNMHSHADITFADNYTLESGSYEWITIPQGQSYGGDTSMFRISTNDISVGSLLQLKQAYINQAAYDELVSGDTVVACALKWNKDGSDKTVERTVAGTNSTNEYGRGNFAGTFLKTSVGTKDGMSGTAVFNTKGELVGVVFGYVGGNGFASNDFDAKLSTVTSLIERESELEDKQAFDGLPGTTVVESNGWVID